VVEKQLSITDHLDIYGGPNCITNRLIAASKSFQHKTIQTCNYKNLLVSLIYYLNL